MKKFVVLAAVALVFCGLTAQSAFSKSQFPKRPLEFVACYGPGGGHDIMMRTLAKIFREEGIITSPINVVNKPGGSSAVALGYVNKYKGNGHYLMATTSSFITTPLNFNFGVNYQNFTPIARLGFDPEILLVNSSKNYNSLEDVLKSDKKVINVGGTGQGSIEHIVTVRLSKLVNKKLNYIPFQGDGQVVAALMGNQVDMIVSNASSAVDFIKSGNFKAIGISADERHELLPQVPTLTELGYPVSLGLFRGVVVPKDVPDEIVQYYRNAFRKLIQTDAWKTGYLKKNSILGAYLEGEAYGRYLEEMNNVYNATLKEVGIIK